MNERQLHVVNRTVPLFSDNNIRMTRHFAEVIGVRVGVHFGAMHKGDNVCILFDGTRFAKVGKNGTLVVAAFHCATEL